MGEIYKVQSLEFSPRIGRVSPGMRMLFTTTTLLSLLVSLALAGDMGTSNEILERQFEPDPKVFGPFGLATSSGNATYHNLKIFGLHIGAGINLAVFGSSSPPIPLPKSRYDTYYLNTTYGFPANTFAPNSTASGTLVYPIYEQYPLAVTGSLSLNSSSNIAQLWLSVVAPSYEFHFDSKGRLGLRGVFDRWYVCPRLATSYGPKTGIAWRLGTGRIDDKECVPIWIKRVQFPK